MAEPVIAPSTHLPESCQVSPSAEIGPQVVMGEQCRVWAFTTIGTYSQLGARCVIGSCCYVGARSQLGDDVHLNHGVFLPNGSRLGNRVFIGPNVTFTDDKHPRVNNPSYHAEPPVIGDDANIGAGAVILPGVHLGAGCTVGAGAVVTKSVPAGETWTGVPARRLWKWPERPKDGGWMRRAAAEEPVGGDDHGSAAWGTHYTTRRFTDAPGHQEAEKAHE